MGFGEELRKLDPDKAAAILQRIYTELADEPDDASEITEGYPALRQMAVVGFMRHHAFRAGAEGRLPFTKPVPDGVAEEVLMDQFLRGVAIGIWAAAVTLKEYAELEEFEDNIAPS